MTIFLTLLSEDGSKLGKHAFLVECIYSYQEREAIGTELIVVDKVGSSSKSTVLVCETPEQIQELISNEQMSNKDIVSFSVDEVCTPGLSDEGRDALRGLQGWIADPCEPSRFSNDSCLILDTNNYDVLCCFKEQNSSESNGACDTLLSLALTLKQLNEYEILYFDSEDRSSANNNIRFVDINEIRSSDLIDSRRGYSPSLMNYLTEVNNPAKTIVVIGELNSADVLRRFDVLLRAGCKVFCSIHANAYESASKRLSVFLSMAGENSFKGDENVCFFSSDLGEFEKAFWQMPVSDWRMPLSEVVALSQLDVDEKKNAYVKDTDVVKAGTKLEWRRIFQWDASAEMGTTPFDFETVLPENMLLKDTVNYVFDNVRIKMKDIHGLELALHDFMFAYYEDESLIFNFHLSCLTDKLYPPRIFPSGSRLPSPCMGGDKPGNGLD